MVGKYKTVLDFLLLLIFTYLCFHFLDEGHRIELSPVPEQQHEDQSEEEDHENSVGNGDQKLSNGSDHDVDVKESEISSPPENSRRNSLVIQQNIPDSALLKPLPNRGQPIKPAPRVIKPSQLRPVLQRQAVLNRASQQVRMAAGGNLGPPSLEAFGNLSPRAQEILKKIYSGDNAPVSDSKGISAKAGSDSNLRKNSFGSGNSLTSLFSSAGNEDSRGFLKRNSLGSTSDPHLPRSLSLQENFLSRRYSVGSSGSSDMSKSLDFDDQPRFGSVSVSPEIPVITVSRPESKTPPMVAENRLRTYSLQSAETTNKVSSALSKFMKSRQINTAGSKPEERIGDVRTTQIVQDSAKYDSEHTGSLTGTDDEMSAGHLTDGDTFQLDDPWFETESENEVDNNTLNRSRSNSMPDCNSFNSKSSAFRAPHQGKPNRGSSLSSVAEIQEEDPKLDRINDKVDNAGNSDSSYSNIKDLAQLRKKSFVESHKSQTLVSSATHFTPIVLSDQVASKPDVPIRSPVVDEAKVKAKKAMELIKLDLKAPKKEKPPPTMLEDLENDAADFVPKDKDKTESKTVEDTSKETTSNTLTNGVTTQNLHEPDKHMGVELTTDQKLKLLFQKHGLGSPNPSPRSSPNPLRTASSAVINNTSLTTTSLSSSKPAINSKLNELESRETLPLVRETSEVNSAQVQVKVETQNELHCSSPILKVKSVAIVQQSPLNTRISFSPISKPEDSNMEPKNEGNTTNSPLVPFDKSLSENNNNQKKLVVAGNKSAFQKHSIADSSDEKQSVGFVSESIYKTKKIDEHGPSQSELRIESNVKQNAEDIISAGKDSSAGSKDLTEKKISDIGLNGVPEITSQGSQNLPHVAKPQNLNCAQDRLDAQGTSQPGSVLTLDSSSGQTASSFMLAKPDDQGMTTQLNMQNFPLQVQLQQDPQTGLFRVLPVGIPLQGIPVQMSSSSSSSQSVGAGSDAMVSPVQMHTPSPSSQLGTSTPVGDMKLTSRKKKSIDTSSDPDSSVHPQRHQHRSLADRKRDHANKKRADRSKYSVSPHISFSFISEITRQAARQPYGDRF